MTCGGIWVPDVFPNEMLTVLRAVNSLTLMLNCVRIGSISGMQRFVVAGQNGFIYFFELPKPRASGPAPTVRSPHHENFPFSLLKFPCSAPNNHQAKYVCFPALHQVPR
jgi:hypothetical protein